jgi:hypothetical protein
MSTGYARMGVILTVRLNSQMLYRYLRRIEQLVMRLVYSFDNYDDYDICVSITY